MEASAKAALAAAAADPDALKIVAKRMSGILRRANATVRPPDDSRTLRNLHDALHGDDGRTLQLFYRDIVKIDWVGVDNNKLEKMNELATKYTLHLNQFDSAIAQAIGIDMEGYVGVDATGKMEHEGQYVADIGNDLLYTVNEEEKAAQKPALH